VAIFNKKAVFLPPTAMNKKLTQSLCLAFLLAFCLSIYAQDKRFGYIRNRQNEPIANVEIEIVGYGERVKSDKVGYYQLVDIPDGMYNLRYTHPAYTQREQSVLFPNDMKGGLGTVILSNRNNTAYQINFLDDNSIDNGQINYPNFAFQLQTRDTYNGNTIRNTRGYVGKYRGLTVGQNEIFINGSNMSAPNTRLNGYNAWNGLNELTQSSNSENNTLSLLNAGIGGTHYLVDNCNDAYLRPKSNIISYAGSNGFYKSKLFANYNSGLDKAGWAYSAAFTSRSGARNPLVEGAEMKAYNFYIGLSKITREHRLNLNMSYAHNSKGAYAAQNKSITDLMGLRYNALWGNDEDKNRNAETKKSAVPLYQLSHRYKTDTWLLQNSLAYQTAVYRDARLQWQEANNPMPDYYRNMPNYYLALGDQSKGESLQEAWRNDDQNITQINWANLRHINQNQANANYGLSSGKLAKYYGLEDLTKECNFHWDGSLRYTHSPKTTLFVNYHYQKYLSTQYAQVADLLGADFAPDANLQHIKEGSPGAYDAQSPMQGKKVGDRTEYQYNYLWRFAQLNPGVFYKSNRLDAMAQMAIGYVQAQRYGEFKSYNDESTLGSSAPFNRWSFGFKSKMHYRLDGFNQLHCNMAYLMHNPYLEDIFINPRYSNQKTPQIQLPISKSIELGYSYRKEAWSLKAFAYMTDLVGVTKLFQSQNNDLLFLDGFNGNSNQNANYITQVVNNINKRHLGLELALQYNISQYWLLNATANIGDYRYTNNPDVYVVSNQKTQAENYLGKAFMTAYRIGGDPQKIYSFGTNYRLRESWNMGLTALYLQDNYINISPILRTNAFVTNPNTGVVYDEAKPQTLARILKQERFDDSFIVNFNASYTHRFGPYSATLSLLVNNLLDNQKSVRYGQENQQFTNYRDYAQDKTSAYPIYGSRYFYNLGRNFFINFALKF
jgi:hypothetical protein